MYIRARLYGNTFADDFININSNICMHSSVYEITYPVGQNTYKL